jgi:uncharacterized membrane protein
MRAFLWSKFWTGLVPILVLAEALTLVSNQLLGVTPVLRVLGGVAIFFMTFALVGLAAGMGARFPRFSAENLSQVAGSYGGIAFMVLAVLFILVVVGLLAWPASTYLWYQYRAEPIALGRRVLMALSLLAALAASLATFWFPMRQGVRALEQME